jgi:hypothetical protein
MPRADPHTYEPKHQDKETHPKRPRGLAVDPWQAFANRPLNVGQRPIIKPGGQVVRIAGGQQFHVLTPNSIRDRRDLHGMFDIWFMADVWKHG